MVGASSTESDRVAWPDFSNNGHSPVIVAEDADLEIAAGTSSGAPDRNAGQVRISPTYFLVHSISS